MRVPHIFSLFASAPFLPELADQNEIKSQYKYWRWRIFYSLFLGYVVFYCTRKSFSYAMPLMLEDLNFSKADLGILGSIFYLTYGFSKFGTGILSDYCNPRYFMAIGLILTGILNLFFASSSTLILFAIIWGFNGLFQGFGWPPITKLITHWYHPQERGKWWSLISCSHNIGGGLIPLLVAAVAFSSSWRWAIAMPGLLGILGGLFLMARLRDVPQSLGLPPIERFNPANGETLASGSVNEEVQESSCDTILTPRQRFVKHVLLNKAIWMLSLAYFFVYVIRISLNDWGSLYMIKQRGYNLLSAASCMTWLEAGGFCGTLASGWATDYFFKGKRIPYMLLCVGGLTLSLSALWLLPPLHYFVDMVIFACTGFFLFGPQLLIGLAATEYVHKKSACAANGFAGSFSYAGAAAAGYPLGKIIDIWDWQGFFVALSCCVVLVFVFLAMLLWTDWRAASPEQPLNLQEKFAAPVED